MTLVNEIAAYLAIKWEKVNQWIAGKQMPACAPDADCDSFLGRGDWIKSGGNDDNLQDNAGKAKD